MSVASPDGTLLFLTGSSVAQNLLRPLLRGLESGISSKAIELRTELVDFYNLGGLKALWAELPVRVANDRSCRGVVTAFLQPTTEAGEAFARAGKALVAVESPLPVKAVTRVAIDHVAGAKDVASALLELGRRRFGYVGPSHETGWASGERLRSIRECLAAAGCAITCDDCMKYDIVESSRTTARMIRREPDLDAIIFASDIHALGGMKALKEAGVGIPAEMAVVGFDDSTAARSVMPPLSSVRQPFEEAGEHAARLFLRIMERPGDTPEEVILQESLILRASCLRSSRDEITYESGTTALTFES